MKNRFDIFYKLGGGGGRWMWTNDELTSYKENLLQSSWSI